MTKYFCYSCGKEIKSAAVLEGQLQEARFRVRAEVLPKGLTCPRVHLCWDCFSRVVHNAVTQEQENEK